MRGKYIEFLKNCKIITEHYEYLVNLTKNHIFVGATNEWIIDNFYLIVETKNNLKRNYKCNKNLKHAMINVNMFDILTEIFEKNNYDISYKSLVKELNNYQLKNGVYLTYRNIETIPTVISMIVIDRIKKLCVAKRDEQEEKQKVRDLIKKINHHRENGEKIDLKDYIHIDESIISNRY